MVAPAPTRHAHRLPLSRPGLAGRGHGPGVLRGVAAAARAVFEEANDALGFDARAARFEGPEAELALTANTQPAVLTASVAAAAALRGARPHARPRRRPQPRRVLGARGRGRAAFRGRRARSCASAASSCRRPCPSGRARWPRSWASTLAAAEAVCAEAAQRRGRRRREHQLARADRHRGAPHGGRARGEAAAARGGKKSVMLPVSAPFHSRADGAGGGAPRRGARRRRRRRDPRVPVVRNVDAGVTRTAADVKPFLLQPGREPRALDRVRAAARSRRAPRLRRGRARAACSPGCCGASLDGARGQSVEDPPGSRRRSRARAEAPA